MKNVVTSLLALCLFATLLPERVYAQMKLGEVLIFNVPTLKPDADTAKFESSVPAQAAPAWKKNAPGMELTLLRADRGNRKGQYLLVWTTDTLARRKGYASASGGSPFTPGLTGKVGEAGNSFAPFVSGDGRYSEYHLLSPEKVGALPVVEILGIHYIKVRPDRREAFERFVAGTLHPAVGNLRPDLRLLYYKSIRGDDPGEYITVMALTIESRDKYWPKGSDSDAVRAAFGPVRPLTTELSSYLVEGTFLTGEKFAAPVFEAKEWTDFVRVQPR